MLMKYLAYLKKSFSALRHDFDHVNLVREFCPDAQPDIIVILSMPNTVSEFVNFGDHEESILAHTVRTSDGSVQNQPFADVLRSSARLSKDVVSLS